MYGQSRIGGQGTKELGRQKNVVVTQHLPLWNINAVPKVGTPRDIDHAPDEGLVEWHHGIPITANPGPVAKRLGDGLAEDDTGVFHRMVTVHVQVAPTLDGEIEQSVTSQSLEHVVEEADAGMDLGVASAVQIDEDA